ncbi:cytochrome P460 [Sphingomonas sp. ABOLD]|uniref:Cytochrome P460 domain-containing protein n=1 Tax=Sphingomonas trueperi TaxID=53317 RepID=A0A7X5Y3Q7_9SPHN|nr:MULTISPECIES: cytochrome P460 family protein [Sphingomonas]NJC00079.1 hypothetical protein [Sphingomonas trueperi]RSV32664.1 cytochrome P460 [Sphingomonas sp. ABOLE]RSV36425.1 cytochrome P460 [Sphingomonas sp. ABOLD]
MICRKQPTFHQVCLGALALSTAAFGLCAVSAARSRQDAGPSLSVVNLPSGYRDWKLISVAQERGKNNDIRAILGNDVAVRAFRSGRRPFPDGAVLVRLAWRYQSSPQNDKVFPAPQSFVAGTPTNVQISVKDAKRYAATGGWGYGQFEGGRPSVDASIPRSCFECHQKLRTLDPAADLVFTHYAE